MAELIHKTISKGRKAIVFGLPWYAVEEEESPRKAGVALAREIPQPFDLVVARKGITPQFGLASTSEGAKNGALSAASIVAEIVQSESWIYVLEIDTSIWICCGRDGFILPYGDRVFENRDEARRAFQELNPSSFKKVYLPGSWKREASNDDLNDVASDTEETDILEFVEYEAPKWGKLASISPLGLILQITSLLVLLGTVGMVANYVMTDTGPQNNGGPTPEQIRAARERLAMQEREERLDLYASLDANRPWHDAPRAAAVFDKCMDGIRDFPTNPVGYELIDIVCDGGLVDGSVSRTSGYSSWLFEWAEERGNIEVSTSSNGDNGFLTRRLPSSPARGPQELAPFSETTETMLRYGQIEGASIDITTPAAAVVRSEPEYTPYYAVSEYQVQTKRPDSWRDFFANTPGLSVEQVVYNLENKTYTMEGELYVPNL